jgi:hypothetical protein
MVIAGEWKKFRFVKLRLERSDWTLKGIDELAWEEATARQQKMQLVTDCQSDAVRRIVGNESQLFEVALHIS